MTTFLIVAVLLAGAWFVVTQPVGQTQGPASEARVDPARLEAHVRTLCETHVPRDARHPENLDRVAAYIRAAFEETGGRVSEQVYEAGGRAYRNVVVRLGPEDGARTIVGAHYDALGDYAGADDNASAVAGLIELAHLLGSAELRAPVELVAYTLEEPPYYSTQWMGSAVHAHSLREGGVQVRLMVCLEMIGRYSDEPGSQGFPTPLLRPFYPSTGNFIGIVGRIRDAGSVRHVKRAMRRATALPVYSLNAPVGTVVAIDWSDHRNYWHHGYPAVMVTDTAFMRNGDYHTAHDTPDKLDYGRMAMVVVGVYEAVLDLAA